MFAGGHRSRVTPVPIPNTEVKPVTADGTAWETVWESRSLPALFTENQPRIGAVSLYSCSDASRRVSHAVPSTGTAARARRASPKKSHCMGNVVWESTSLPALFTGNQPRYRGWFSVQLQRGEPHSFAC